MTTIEGLNRREFLFPFAKGKAHSRLPSQQAGSHHSPTQPKRPEKGSNGFTRRQFIPLAVVGAAGGIGVLTGILHPWDRSNPQPEFSQPETLESLIAQARKMEEQFRSQDLADKVIRKKYVDILADAFALHTFPSLSKDDIANSVLFGETLQGYISLSNQYSLRPDLPNLPNYDYTDDVAATTDTGKIIVNLSHPIFHLKNMTNPIYPKGWNPLKSLRRILSHEFNHLITPIIFDEELFNVSDLDATYQERRVAGFSIRAFHPINRLPISANAAIDEAAVELQAANFSSLFGSSVEIKYLDIYGQDIAAIALRLSNLTKTVGISLEQLSSLNRGSKLKEFLLLLAEKAKISPQATLVQKLEYGFKVCDALKNNDQVFLQDFSSRATLPR